MMIDRVLFPITTLGPGNRIVIWTIGCEKHCPSCANEELWAKNDDKNVEVHTFFETFTETFSKVQFDGITITGGDPLEQKDEILELLPLLKSICSDILLYTGYTLEEVSEKFGASGMKQLAQNVSVLIDGRYIEELNDNKVPLRGSTNQRIMFFDSSIQRKYEQYLEQGRKIQSVFYGEKVISVGIHNKDITKKG